MMSPIQRPRPPMGDARPRFFELSCELIAGKLRSIVCVEALGHSVAIQSVLKGGYAEIASIVFARLQGRAPGYASPWS